MNKVKLICVTPNNNNKFYYMEDLNNGTFLAEYGRVGSASSKVTYSIRDWDKKYNEKLKKGYVDVSESLRQDIQKGELKIDDEDVKDLISFLMSCARQSIKSNYQVNVDNISDIQINKVQSIIDELSKNDSITLDEVNDKLKLIYTTIPRKMEDTRNYFFTTKNFTPNRVIELLQEEQNKLNTLKSQITINNQVKVDSNITLESLGFDCVIASQDDRDLIAKQTDFRVNKQRIFKITNKETEKVFNPNNLKTKLLYHGSRNENFLSILQNGLKIRPSGVATTGSMFGDGIYGANKARKSIGYTSLRGSYWASGSSNRAYLAIFEFATGKEYEVLKNQKYQHWMSRLNEKEVKDKGYDSVFAQGGADLRNDEYIIYNSNQCTVRYLIELTEDN